jgi:Dolichyl-phosphate-mannose-protein mannosyltransferase
VGSRIRVHERIRTLRRTRFGIALFVLSAIGTLHGLVYAPFVNPHRTLDSPAYEAAAHAILDGSYSTPLGDLVPSTLGFRTQPTPLGDVDLTGLHLSPAERRAKERQTVRTPGYPLLLALVGGGSTAASRGALYGVQAVLLGLAVALLGLFGRLVWDERAGLAAAALYALDPFTKRYVSLVLTETLAGVLAVGCAYFYARAWGSGRTAWWGVTAVTLAALTLTRPAFAILLPLLALAPVLRRARLPSRIAGSAAVVVCAGALLAPWLVWTTSVTGRTVLASFGDGWNLLLAAHGEGPDRSLAVVLADPSYERDFGSVRQLAPAPAVFIRDPDAHGRYLAAADARQRRLAFETYRRRLRHDPAEVVEEVAYRGYLLWMADKDWRQPVNAVVREPLRALDWITIALAAGGIVLALVAGGPARGPGIALLVFTAFSAIQHVEPRYGLPLRGLLLAFAALSILRLAAALSSLVRS